MNKTADTRATLGTSEDLSGKALVSIPSEKELIEPLDSLEGMKVDFRDLTKDPTMASVDLKTGYTASAKHFVESLGFACKYFSDQCDEVKISKASDTLLSTFKNEMQASGNPKKTYREFLGKLSRLIAQDTTMAPTPREAFKLLKLAANLKTWDGPATAVCTIQKVGNNTIVEITIPLVGRYTLDQFKEYKNIFNNKPPQWFQDLPPLAQKYLQDKLEQFKNVEVNEENLAAFNKIMLSAPSHFRVTPGIANFRKERTVIYNEKNEKISDTSVLRHAAPVPIQIKNRTVRHQLTMQNLEQLEQTQWEDAPNASEKTIVLDSLLSPLKGGFGSKYSRIAIAELRKAVKEGRGKGKKWNLVFRPTNEFHRSELSFLLKKRGQEESETRQVFLKGAFKTICDIFSKNKQKGVTVSCAPFVKNFYDFNDIKLFLQSINENRENYPKVAKQIFENEPEKQTSLLILINAFRNYLLFTQQLSSMPAKRHPTLYEASLEVLISSHCASLAGHPVVPTSFFCKSGKDRTGILPEHVRAMELYFLQKGSLPTPRDKKEDRNSFIDMLSQVLIESGHAAHVAAANTPGAYGISSQIRRLHKIPLYFTALLPKDMSPSGEIRERVLNEQKLSKISSPKANMKEGMDTKELREKLNLEKSSKKDFKKDNKKDLSPIMMLKIVAFIPIVLPYLIARSPFRFLSKHKNGNTSYQPRTDEKLAHRK